MVSPLMVTVVQIPLLPATRSMSQKEKRALELQKGSSSMQQGSLATRSFAPSGRSS